MSEGRIVLDVPRLPPCNASRNVHWRVKYTERQDWGVLLKLAMGRQSRVGLPFARARAVFTRQSSREPDSDNLVASFKLVRDLLQVEAMRRNPYGLGIIQSDAPGWLEAEYRWEKAARGKGGIRIEVEAIVDG